MMNTILHDRNTGIKTPGQTLTEEVRRIQAFVEAGDRRRTGEGREKGGRRSGQERAKGGAASA